MELEEGTYGWYVKTLCEYCKDQAIVNALISGIRNIGDNYHQEDIYLFDNLFYDIHVSDAFDTPDNLILKIIISCFTTDYVLETDNSQYIAQYATYSKLGRQIYGYGPNALTKYLESWDDFNNLYGVPTYIRHNKPLTDAEILEKWNDTDFIEEQSEMSMRSGILVVDENMENLADLENVLENFGFDEVVPGLYFSGLMYYADVAVNNVIDEDTLQCLFDTLQSYDKIAIHKDEDFVLLNEEHTGYGNATKMDNNLDICSTSMEVIL